VTHSTLADERRSGIGALADHVRKGRRADPGVGRPNARRRPPQGYGRARVRL